MKFMALKTTNERNKTIKQKLFNGGESKNCIKVKKLKKNVCLS